MILLSDTYPLIFIMPGNCFNVKIVGVADGRGEGVGDEKIYIFQRSVKSAKNNIIFCVLWPIERRVNAIGLNGG